jgi:hypothetical protein
MNTGLKLFDDGWPSGCETGKRIKAGSPGFANPFGK